MKRYIEFFIKTVCFFSIITVSFCCFSFSSIAHAAAFNSPEVSTKPEEAVTTQSAISNCLPTTYEIAQSFEYLRGSFKQLEITNLYEEITTLNAYFKRGNLSFAVPYVAQKAPSGSILTLPSGSQSLINQSATHDGIGDFTLNGTYYLFKDGEDIPFTNGIKVPLDINLYGYLKFPTASSRKGIGTARADEGFGIGGSKNFLSKWRAFSDINYTFIGDRPDISFNDEIWFDAGIEYAFTPKFTMSFAYEESNCVVKNQLDLLDFAVSANYYLTDKIRFFEKTAFSGISPNSPGIDIDFGAAVAF